MATNNAINQTVVISGTPSVGYIPVATSANAATWQNFSSSLISPQQVVYVSLNGNDSTGTGTFYNPFATVSAAQTFIGSSATPTTRYIIFAAVGSFALPATFNPNIMFKGLGVQLTAFSGNTNINNTNWNNGNDNRGYFMDCSTTGAITFDCTTQASNTSAKLYLYNVRCSVAHVFTANNAINQGVAQNCELFAGMTFSGGTFNVNCCMNNAGTYTVNSNAAVATTVMINGGKNNGNYAINFTAGHGVITTTLAAAAPGLSTTLALSGASANVRATSSSLPTWSNISYAGGASVANILPQNNSLPPIVGQATLVAGLATVSNVNVQATSNILLTPQNNSTLGIVRVSAKTAGTSFGITSTLLTDTGVITYVLYP